MYNLYLQVNTSHIFNTLFFYFTGLTKVDVDHCFENATRKMNHSWLFVFNCLHLWKQKTQCCGSRLRLFRSLNQALEKGFVCKSDISFLLEKVRSETFYFSQDKYEKTYICALKKQRIYLIFLL